MNSAHLHLMLNHLPVVGSVFALLLLVAALMRKSQELQKASLVVFAIIALTAVPVYLTGEPAEKLVERLPGITEAVIEQHEEAAEVAFISVLALGVAALGGLAFAWRARPLPRWFAIVLLLLSVTTMGLMLRTANLGGQVRHTEIRKHAALVDSPVQHTPREEAD